MLPRTISLIARKKYLLDSLPQAKFAFSTRRLSSKYYGAPCMLIARASDGKVIALGFRGDNLDKETLQVFGSGTDVYIQGWYDQSGNNRTLTETPDVPQIMFGGVLRTVNGMASPYFPGAGFLSNAGISTVPIFLMTTVAVVKVDSLVANRTIFGSNAVGGFKWRVNTSGLLSINKDGGITIGTSNTPIDTGAYSVSASYDNTNWNMYLSGSLDGAGVNAQTITASSARIGNSNAAEQMAGYIPEIMQFDMTGAI